VRDHKRHAQQAVTEAHARFAAGDRDGAVQLLGAFSPPHEIVSQALAALEQEAGVVRAREQEAEARRQAEARAREEEAAEARRQAEVRAREEEDVEARRQAKARAREEEAEAQRRAEARAREQEAEARRQAEVRARKEEAAREKAEAQRQAEARAREQEAEARAREEEAATARRQAALAAAITRIEGHLAAGRIPDAERALAQAEQAMPPSPGLVALRQRAALAREHRLEQLRGEAQTALVAGQFWSAGCKAAAVLALAPDDSAARTLRTSASRELRAAVLRPFTTRRAWAVGAAALILVAVIGIRYFAPASAPSPATATPEAVTPAGPGATPPAAAGEGAPTAADPIRQPPPGTTAGTDKADPGSGRQPQAGPRESVLPPPAQTAAPRRDPATGRSRVEPSTTGTRGDPSTTSPRAGPPVASPRVETPAAQPAVEPPAPGPESAAAPLPAKSAPPQPQTAAREEARTAGNRPAPDDTRPATPAPAPVRPAVGRDEEMRRITAVMRRYEAAYDTLDAREVQAVYPSQSADLSKAFASYRSYDLGIDIRKIDLSPDAADATVEVRMSHDFRPVVGRRQQFRDSQTFTLRKQGDAWIIVERK
jgi:colicin import membrane protein